MLAGIPDSAFRLKWRLTWPEDGRPRGFVACVENKRVCRICKTVPPSLGVPWWWSG